MGRTTCEAHVALTSAFIGKRAGRTSGLLPAKNQRMRRTKPCRVKGRTFSAEITCSDALKQGRAGLSK